MKKFNPEKKKAPGLEIVRSYDDVKNFTTTFALFTVHLSALGG